MVAPLVSFYFGVEHMPLPFEEILDWLRRHELVRLIEIERTIFDPMMDRATLAAAIASIATLTGEFTLRSGAVSREYFDKYRFESDPHLLAAVADLMHSLVPPSTQVIAGLELGGVPIVTALALRTGLPAVFVRKHAKDYGTRQLEEGCDVRGRRVLVVEDVLTSGGQVIASVNDLRALGAIVSEAICVIDRESGGADALAAAGITLRCLFTKTDLRLAATPG
jgi:orotate phosphoribosyltransferase